MVLTKKQIIVAGSLLSILAIGLVVGITVGVVVRHRKSVSLTIEEQVYQILENNPLIDG